VHSREGILLAYRTSEECATSDWSKVADPGAGIGGSCLACPGGHVIFARQTWVA